MTGVGNEALSPLSTPHFKSLVSRFLTLPHFKKSVFRVVIIRKPLKPASAFADVCLQKFHVARHYWLPVLIKVTLFSGWGMFRSHNSRFGAMNTLCAKGQF